MVISSVRVAFYSYSAKLLVNMYRSTLYEYFKTQIDAGNGYKTYFLSVYFLKERCN